MRVLQAGESGFPSADAWDEFVSAGPHGHLLQSWAWGELKERFGWRALRLAVSDGSQLVGAAQVLIRRLPYRCLAYVPRGPVIDPADGEASRALLSAVHHVAQDCRAIALKVEPAWDDSPEASRWWQAQGFRESTQTVQPRNTIIVDLRPEEEAILAQMHSKTRYAIRVAVRREVTIRSGTAGDLPVFNQLLRETSERQGFGIHTPEYYETAFRLFEPAGRVALLLAYYQDQPLATVMALAFGRQAIYMFGASSDRERARMPNQLLQWETMRWAKSLGCAEYDLWGISDQDPDSGTSGLTGVERFKAGFGGGQTRCAGAFDYVYSPLAYRGMNWMRDRRRRLAARRQERGQDQ